MNRARPRGTLPGMEALTPGLVAEIACNAASWAELERAVIELSSASVGADTLFFAGVSGPTETCVGVIAPHRARVRERWRELACGIQPLVDVAVAGDGVVIDSELLGSALERVPYYDAVMRPVRGRTTLLTFLDVRERSACKLALGRCHGTRAFSARERAVIVSIVPTLKLAWRALGAPARAQSCLALAPLTPRESEVLGYLRLGYTNREIGLALGTRERTVRNQLSAIYGKLGVSTRAEAVGWWASHERSPT
jgi:DNA-binding CsgD family transcriptional regulator